MIRIAIVEDEQLYTERLEEFILRYQQESGYEFTIQKFSDGDQILLNYKGDYDIILMDIQMRFMDGMSAAEKIRQMDEEVIIMFITNMTQYALRGYEVQALDYMLKPVEYFPFTQKLGRAIERMYRRRDHYIAIPLEEGVQKLKISSIYYIECQGHRLIYQTKTGEFVSRGTMKALEELIDKYGFFRSNKGYLVNMKHVDGIKDNCCVIRGEKLLISRARRKAFMEALVKYMSEVVK
ncbi:MAG: LytTR family DNA-binding domain-containing protein [Hespellia sp.]|nr:LytTR family DNA-binding domain-containing protein [Hespellia sp.]